MSPKCPCKDFSTTCSLADSYPVRSANRGRVLGMVCVDSRLLTLLVGSPFMTSVRRSRSAATEHMSRPQVVAALAALGPDTPARITLEAPGAEPVVHYGVLARSETGAWTLVRVAQAPLPVPVEGAKYLSVELDRTPTQPRAASDATAADAAPAASRPRNPPRSESNSESPDSVATSSFNEAKRVGAIVAEAIHNSLRLEAEGRDSRGNTVRVSPGYRFKKGVDSVFAFWQFDTVHSWSAAWDEWRAQGHSWALGPDAHPDELMVFKHRQRAIAQAKDDVSRFFATKSRLVNINAFDPSVPLDDEAIEDVLAIAADLMIAVAMILYGNVSAAFVSSNYTTYAKPHQGPIDIEKWWPTRNLDRPAAPAPRPNSEAGDRALTFRRNQARKAAKAAAAAAVASAAKRAAKAPVGKKTDKANKNSQGH